MTETGSTDTRADDDVTVIADEAIHPFQVDVPQEALDDLRRRVADMRWPERETVDDRTSHTCADGPSGTPIMAWS